MEQLVEKNMDHLKELLGVVSDLESANALLAWDQQTYMPPGGAGARAMQLATLSRLAHDKFVSEELVEALELAKAEAAGMAPDSDEFCLVRKTDRDYQKKVKVPSEWVGEFSSVRALAHQDWEKARAESNFSLFEPRLEKLVELKREYAGFFTPYDHIYDPLLDDFEPGMKAADIKTVFATLRPRLIALVQAIAERGKPVNDALLHQSYDEKKQWDFGIEVAKAFGYDFNRGRQDKAVHPFTIGFGTGDIRITTRFDPEFLNTALFGTMHEAGHAMYEQGVDPKLDRTPLGTGTSLGIHESQSRMWENLVGRSKAFWSAYFPRLQEYFPSQLGETDLNAFYRMINKVERSLIRVEADEATYDLHIMLRFELEVSLMNGSLAVKDLPEAWNKKFEEFLGITPPNDAKGVLQDVHWSMGLFGYFPTYALGNLIAAQLWNKINLDIPEIEKKITKAEFSDLLDWLQEHIHRHGAKYNPLDLLKQATGQDLDAEPYLQYIEGKFGDIYEL
jgi:carboxypeptidase Taq